MQVGTALVTGATDGLGAAIARRLGTDRFHVIVHGREYERGASVVEAITKAGGSAEFVGADLLVIDDLASLCELCRGRIDVLVNNAGGGGRHQTWWETDRAKWDWVFSLNVFATAELCRRLVPHMIANRRGRVVNVSSVAADRPLDIGPEYAAAKASIWAMTVSLAKACAGTGVTCNSISPGLMAHSAIVNGIARPAGDDADTPSVRADVFPTLTGRLPTAAEVADMVAFLASDRAASITGEDIMIDGGYRHFGPSYGIDITED